VKKEGSLPRPVFRHILMHLPIGLPLNEIDTLIDSQTSLTSEGSVNYLLFLTSPVFKEYRFVYNLRRASEKTEILREFQEDKHNDKIKGIFQFQKVILEAAIFLEDFELVIFTTVSPKTSIIFISKIESLEHY